MQKVKVTKRQRKALGRNFMVKECKKAGQPQEVGLDRYMGKPPVYAPYVPHLHAATQYRKVEPGVPFVRA